jgi:hypothetical protein
MKMLILLDDLKEFKKRTETLSKDKYDVYVGTSFILLRPSVTTRGRDSFLIENLTLEQIDEFIRWWGSRNVFRVSQIEFDETKYRV